MELKQYDINGENIRKNMSIESVELFQKSAISVSHINTARAGDSNKLFQEIQCENKGRSFASEIFFLLRYSKSAELIYNNMDMKHVLKTKINHKNRIYDCRSNQVKKLTKSPPFFLKLIRNNIIFLSSCSIIGRTDTRIIFLSQM